jgi:hypothetical protein
MRRHLLVYALLIAWVGLIVIAYRLHFEGAFSKTVLDVIVAIVVLAPLAFLLARTLRKNRHRKRPRDQT